MAQGGSVLDLIWAACLGSDGQGGLGCWAAALNAGVGFRGGGFTGGGQTQSSRANSSGRRAREAQHGTLNPPVPIAGSGGARSCARDGGGDSGHRESAGGRCPASGVTHRPKHRVQRERKVGVGLT